MLPTSTIRLLPYAISDGPTNMAMDETMLLGAEAGVASLRFYGWSPATLSLGYFQLATSRLSDTKLAELPWVRRSTGGATLVHDCELTYALALPPDPPWQSAIAWMPRWHGILAASLRQFGVPVEVVAQERIEGEVLCFQKQTMGDLICRGHKIGGSAQRKHRRCLLQHGSILLRRSPWAEALPGIQELTDIDVAVDRLQTEVLNEFRRETDWDVEPGTWSENERTLTESLASEKYRQSNWNEKR